MPIGLETALAPLAKEKGLLTLLYQDLAQPGVQQVGKALATVLGVGNTLLIPLRMLNAAGAAAERASFDQIADRFAAIPPDEVIEVRPEIGVPIIEKLSQTTDEDTRALFIELLASAASAQRVMDAHPSFPSIISNLSPDEAKILTYIKNKNVYDFPMVAMKLVSDATNTYKLFADLEIKYPNNITYPENIALYVSNMSGLGLMDVLRGSELGGKDQEYESIYDTVRERFGMDRQYEYQGELRTVTYERHVLRIQPLGQTFLKACVP